MARSGQAGSNGSRSWGDRPEYDVSTAVSVGFWFLRTGAANVIILSRGTTLDGYWNFRFSTSNFLCSVRPGATPYNATATTTDWSVWRHVGLRWSENGTVEIMVDGVAENASASTTGTLGARSDEILLTFRNLNFVGAFAHLAVWNVRLSDDDFASLAAGYAPSLIRPDALFFHDPLDGDPRTEWSNTVATDADSGTVLEADDPPIIYSPGVLSVTQGGGAGPTGSGPLHRGRLIESNLLRGKLVA